MNSVTGPPPSMASNRRTLKRARSASSSVRMRRDRESAPAQVGEHHQFEQFHRACSAARCSRPPRFAAGESTERRVDGRATTAAGAR